MVRNTRGIRRADQIGAGRSHTERRAIAARRASWTMVQEQTSPAPVRTGR